MITMFLHLQKTKTQYLNKYFHPFNSLLRLTLQHLKKGKDEQNAEMILKTQKEKNDMSLQIQQIMNGQMAFPFILMRHGESEHNVAKKQIKAKNNGKKVKGDSKQNSIKYSLHLRDCGLTQNGIEQCRKIIQQLDWENIGLIWVSPLQRCLQTCSEILSHVGKKIPVIVEPLLSSKLSNAWSVGSDWSFLKKLYPQWTFESQNQLIPWYINSLTEEKQKEIRKFQDPVEAIKCSVKQSSQQYINRLSKVKQKLESYQQKLSNQRILIISHTRMLKNMTASDFTEKGKAITISEFENMTPIYCNYTVLFRSIKNKSQNNIKINLFSQKP